MFSSVRLNGVYFETQLVLCSVPSLELDVLFMWTGKLNVQLKTTSLLSAHGIIIIKILNVFDFCIFGHFSFSDSECDINSKMIAGLTCKCFWSVMFYICIAPKCQMILMLKKMPQCCGLVAYRGIRVGAENCVLPDDSIELQWRKPGDEHHWGRRSGSLHTSWRTWNCLETRTTFWLFSSVLKTGHHKYAGNWTNTADLSSQDEINDEVSTSVLCVNLWTYEQFVHKCVYMCLCSQEVKLDEMSHHPLWSLCIFARCELRLQHGWRPALGCCSWCISPTLQAPERALL